MDPGTQGLLGAVAAQAVLGRRGNPFFANPVIVKLMKDEAQRPAREPVLWTDDFAALWQVVEID